MIKDIVWRFFSHLPVLNRKNWVLVLCYHSISTEEPYISVHPEIFKKQIDKLNSKKDIDFISLQDLLDIFKGIKELDNNSILLTFDDAYHDFLYAFEYLKSLSIPSVLAVIGNSVVGRQVTGISNTKSILSKDEIKYLSSTNMVAILPHGITHRDLSTLTKKEIAQEINLSANLIAELTGDFPKAFIYPFGSYNSDVVNETFKQDFDVAFTIDGGRVTTNSLNHLIPRYCINSFTKDSFFDLISSDGLIHYAYAKSLFHIQGNK